MNNHYNKFNAHPVVIFRCGNARIHTVITVHTRKWVLTIPLHLAVLSCFHLLWITWLRAPLGPTGAENRADLLFSSAGETVNIFLHLHIRELVLKRVEEEITLGFINILFQWQMKNCSYWYEFYSLDIWNDPSVSVHWLQSSTTTFIFRLLLSVRLSLSLLLLKQPKT